MTDAKPKLLIVEDDEGLQAQLSRRDPGQVVFLLLFRTMPQDRAHGVHLGVAGACVATGLVDRLQDHRAASHRKAGPAIFLGDERCQIA